MRNGFPALALAVLCGVAFAGPTPGPVPQKRVEGVGLVKVNNDGGAYGISLNFADAGTQTFTGVVADSFTLSDGGAIGSSSSFDAGSVMSATTADLNLWVNVDGGSDSNACTDAGAPCLTIQGAWSKAPKFARHHVEITAACGSYTGANLVGAEQINDTQAASGGIIVQGTWANSVLASGSATGTATSGTASVNGDGLDGGRAWVQATLTKTGAGWTVNDLTGRYLFISSGSASSATTWSVISSNTADTITVVGFLSAPSATSVFAIQEPCSVIATAVPALPTALTTTPPVVSGTSGNSFNISGHFVGSSGLVVRRFATTATAGTVNIKNASGVALTNFTNAVASTANKVTVSGVGADGVVGVSNSYLAMGGSDTTSTIIQNSGVGGISVAGSLLVNGRIGLAISFGFGTIFFSESRNIFRGIARFAAATPSSITSSVIGGGGGQSEECVLVGSRNDGAGVSSSVTLDHVHFQNCDLAIEQGGGWLYVTTYSITPNASTTTTRRVINCLGGGHAIFNAIFAGPTSQALTPSAGGDYDVIAGGRAGRMTDIDVSDYNGNGCLSSALDGSAVCKNFPN